MTLREFCRFSIMWAKSSEETAAVGGSLIIRLEYPLCGGEKERDG